MSFSTGRAEREEVSAFYAAAGVPYEWHYIEVSDSDWQRNLLDRSCAGADSYAAESGLLAKMEALFDPPVRGEMDVWHQNRR